MRNKVTDWEERNQSVDGGRFQVIGYVYLILSTFLKEHVLFLHPEERFCVLTHLETTNSERTRKGLDEKLVVFIQRQNSACLKAVLCIFLVFLYFQDALSLPLYCANLGWPLWAGKHVRALETYFQG